MMEARGWDWRTVLLALGAAGGAILALAWAFLMLIFAAGEWMRGAAGQTEAPPLDIAVLFSAMVVIAAAFVPAAYFSIQRLRGQQAPPATPQLLKAWQGILLALLWVGSAFAAQALLPVPVLRWITPAFYILAITIPVYFFARLATGGIDPGSRARYWGALATGMGLGTTLAISAEIVLAMLGLIGLGVFLSLHPENIAALMRLVDELTNTVSPEQALELLSPWLNNPLAAVGALLFFSVLSPLIEETSKSLAAWTIFDRLTSNAQGFALGAMSGAAFGLVESLLVSASPESNWATTLLVRGASTMMHIMAASLTGWGIASFRLTKRPFKMIGMYLLAMSLHGVWNACVVAITFGGLRSFLAPSGSDVMGIALIAAGVGLLVILCLLIPAALAATNWQFRVSEKLAAAKMATMATVDAAAFQAAHEVTRAPVEVDKQKPDDNRQT